MQSSEKINVYYISFKAIILQRKDNTNNRLPSTGIRVCKDNKLQKHNV